MKLTLGFSPCPNDTFIFDALVNGNLDTEGFEFEPVLEDVQTLNDWAAQGKLDITKLSMPAVFNHSDKYAILSSGAALGKGVGPLLIANRRIATADIADCTIAIPGEATTANFLLDFAFPVEKVKKPMLFSSIEDAVLAGEVDLGVIIHENRFTYSQKGLQKVMDLGEYWEVKTGSPIPLGCIAIKRSIDSAIQQKVDSFIRQSLINSFQTYPAISDYVKSHAQAMDEAVMRQHIELYANDFSLDLGEEGKKAINTLRKSFQKNNNVELPELTYIETLD